MNEVKRENMKIVRLRSIVPKLSHGRNIIIAAVLSEMTVIVRKF